MGEDEIQKKKDAEEAKSANAERLKAEEEEMEQMGKKGRRASKDKLGDAEGQTSLRKQKGDKIKKMRARLEMVRRSLQRTGVEDDTIEMLLRQTETHDPDWARRQAEEL